ncbi:MAG: hypothetical protein AAGA96_02735 [Verrucomicrobiota bacterium]
MATLVLIPEAIFFFALAGWKASRFISSVRSEGAPVWYLLISSISLVTGAVFCLLTCRRLLRQGTPYGSRVAADSEESEESERDHAEPRFVRRIGKLWLSFAFSICVFVLPPLLFLMGLVLDRRSEAEWLVGVPIGIAIVIYLSLLPQRFRGRRKVS